MDNKSYIGDGVYAKFDGYGIWLEANIPTSDRIYLEPSVLRQLNDFWKRCHDTSEQMDGFELDE